MSALLPTHRAVGLRDEWGTHFIGAKGPGLKAA
jgi:hypothetical protein